MACRLGLVSLLLLSTAAQAQKASFDAQLFRPPATAGGILALDSAYVPPHRRISASIFFDYTNRPLLLRDAQGHDRDVISNLVDSDLAVSLALWQRLELGALLPVLLYQRPGDDSFLAERLTQSAVGDLRLEAKVLIGVVPVGKRDRSIAFALAASVALPTGDDNAFYAEDGVSFRPRLVVTGRLRPVELTLQLGTIIRGERDLLNLQIAQQFSFGLGARVDLVRGLKLSGTIAGATGLDGTTGAAGTPVEFLVGPEYWFDRVPIHLVLAAGRGVSDAYGAPNARLVFALRYQPRAPGDRDGDGVLDDADACPDRPGPRENRGCPDGDRDADGVIDRLDVCPDFAGPVENHGCPPAAADADSDADGVIDRLDDCPEAAGPVENRGCPWSDSDGDGVLDREDRCPTVRGVRENQGCPDEDSDGDGIVDRLDKCPFEREVVNGFEDDDGCPDQLPAARRRRP
jgi:hypothetical protein